MTKQKPWERIADILIEVCTDEQLGNLKWHLENKTLVACGKRYMDFRTKQGHM